MQLIISCCHLGLVALAVGLGNVVTSVHNEVLGAVVVAAREVTLEDGLGAVGVADLGVDRGTGHVRDHGVAAAPGALDSAQRVVGGGGLGEPDITTVSAEVARLDGLGDILLDDNGTASGVDEPGACSGELVFASRSRQSIRGALPFFILAMSSLLNRPRVFSCRGQLMVTTSH